MNGLLIEILRKANEKKVSDVHLISGDEPAFRKDGDLYYLHEIGELTEEQIKDMIMPILSPMNVAELNSEKETDFAFSMPEVENIRYRGNIHTFLGKTGVALRVLSDDIPSFSSLNLPRIIENFADFPNGLVLVTGATGSGKSTTLAALIDKINKSRSCNIVTIEDPIEYLYKKDKSVIRQREVGRDTPSFQRGLKGVLRQDPDVILIGEIRDLESIETALTAAQTGHLVFTTLHTNSAAETINRIVDVFPEEKQKQIRIQLAAVLRAIVCQDLIKKVGGGRTVATEIMVGTKAISNLIINGQVNQINAAIETGSVHGMHTMESSLKKLYKNRTISREEYEKRASNLESGL